MQRYKLCVNIFINFFTVLNLLFVLTINSQNNKLTIIICFINYQLLYHILLRLPIGIRKYFNRINISLTESLRYIHRYNGVT